MIFVKNNFCTIILYFCISAFKGTPDRKLRSFVMYFIHILMYLHVLTVLLHDTCNDIYPIH